MAQTQMRIDLYGKAPYYVLTAPESRTVYVTTNGQFAVGGYVYEAEGYSGTGDSLAALRSDIVGNLDTMRQEVFAAIRGDNAGPVMIQRYAAFNSTRVQQFRDMARRATRAGNATLAAEYTYMASIEYTYMVALQAAQQVVQDAVYNGADFIDGDFAYTNAKRRRGQMVEAAVAAYNRSLPFASHWPRKEAFTIGIEWGMN